MAKNTELHLSTDVPVLRKPRMTVVAGLRGDDFADLRHRKTVWTKRHGKVCHVAYLIGLGKTRELAAELVGRSTVKTGRQGARELIRERAIGVDRYPVQARRVVGGLRRFVARAGRAVRILDLRRVTQVFKRGAHRRAFQHGEDELKVREFAQRDERARVVPGREGHLGSAIRRDNDRLDGDVQVQIVRREGSNKAGGAGALSSSARASDYSGGNAESENCQFPG